MKNKLLGLLVVLGVSAPAFAQSEAGYWHDASGKIARSGYGDCWRTGRWTPQLAVPECDPDLARKAQPEVAAPKPAPAEPPRVVEPAPTVQAPVAPIEPPAPAVAAPVAPAPVAKPAPQPPRRIALESSASFALGKAQLSAAGRQAIDRDVLSQLDKFTRIDGISVVGHTDPLGSEKLNMQLSKDRAEAVKGYMVNKGVRADLIRTDGVGSSQQVPGVECAANLPRSALAACLAPHRRIEIDVAGEAK